MKITGRLCKIWKRQWRKPVWFWTVDVQPGRQDTNEAGPLRGSVLLLLPLTPTFHLVKTLPVFGDFSTLLRVGYSTIPQELSGQWNGREQSLEVRQETREFWTFKKTGEKLKLATKWRPSLPRCSIISFFFLFQIKIFLITYQSFLLVKTRFSLYAGLQYF